ncbi:putative alcohol dehydrogenase, zinc-containing [Colletotrichum sojae]|uniref:Putative alcohol dehydrogenase, zinc-containing n=1 Tax=Colletotrichum sojae TaxID=2175907 RepID=A0A8H6IRN9_9PEZI|nr:putative alcohol dehydrogenase, zinc-containing [Colletotrichum sojae]
MPSTKRPIPSTPELLLSLHPHVVRSTSVLSSCFLYTPPPSVFLGPSSCRRPSMAPIAPTLAKKGLAWRNAYFQPWASILPEWLSTGDIVSLSHEVIKALNPHPVKGALDDPGRGDGVRRGVEVGGTDDHDEGRRAGDI